MDFQSFTDTVAMPCCVISVQKTPEGDCGEIRILCANKVYKEIMGPGYYDNMLYHELVPRDNKFEDFCFRAAVLGQRMHAYVETKALNTWTDQTLIPLASDREDIGYCQFIFEYTKRAEADRMASVSVDTSALIIKTSITLMSSRDFISGVESVLDDVNAFSGGKASRIMLVDHNSKKSIVFARRYASGAAPKTNNPPLISYETICTWEKLIGVSNSLILKDAHDYAWLKTENPFWAEEMQEAGVKSLVLIPLRRAGEVIGYLYVINFDTSRAVQVKELVELLSYILGAEIYNHLLLKRLDHMSHTDPLTGLNNRNAMIRRMDEMKQNRNPAGVLSLDLNCLKNVNDEQGHDAGDQMIIAAGQLLCQVFSADDIFRTGGDEFVVIIQNIDAEAFARKVECLRRDDNNNPDVNFAVGASWTDGSEDFTTLFRKADQRMYEDKELCYLDHPEWKRR